MLDFIRYKELQTLSKYNHFEIEKLANEINTNIWENYKQYHKYNLFIPFSMEEYISILNQAIVEIEKNGKKQKLNFKNNNFLKQ